MEKRNLPRHVDARIIIFGLTLKRLFKILPIVIISLIVMVQYASPLTLILAALTIGISYGLMYEFKNRETGYSWILGIVQYKINGDQFYQRYCLQIDESKRTLRREE